MSSPAILFVAGDPSGDHNTAPVIRQLRKDAPECKCFGIGGPMMQAEGFTTLLPFEEFNRMGYIEVITHLSFFLNAKKMLVQEMKNRKPDLLVCVDYSGFNTQIMKEAHGLGIPVLWYIAPKIWAWKKKKHTTNLKKYVTHIAAIFPFEVELFQPYVKNTTFVGNPLVEYIDSKQYMFSTASTEDLQKKDIIRLAIVPGSRPHEIEKILPVMMEAYVQLKQKYPQVTAILSRCNHIPREMYRNCIGGTAVDYCDDTLEDLYTQSDLALVTSGTATLQTALMGVPMIIMYKTSYITYLIYKTFITGIDHIGLPNIIARREIVPELIQNDMTVKNLVKLLEGYIESPDTYQSVVKELVSLKESLGSRKPSKEVTALIKRLAGIGDK